MLLVRAFLRTILGLVKKKSVNQPKWALESKDGVVKTLVAQDIPVTRRNYIELAYLGEHDPGSYLPAELEMSLPEPLRMLDGRTGRERKHR